MNKSVKRFGLVAGATFGATLTLITLKRRHFGYQNTDIPNTIKTVADKDRNIYKFPMKNKRFAIGYTNELVGKEVKIIARVNHGKQTLYRIKRAGKTYGWVDAAALKEPSEYLLPFTYTSQLSPTYAPNGCEAASLKMALSTKGIANDISYQQFLDGIPTSNDYNHGYDRDPYEFGSKAAISAIGLATYARKFGAVAKDISGTSVQNIIDEIKQGNPVVFEGTWRMNRAFFNHVPVAVGYRNGEILVADPYAIPGYSKRIFWVSVKQFKTIYNMGQKLALVIK